jgi:hypothetical protein
MDKKEIIERSMYSDVRIFHEIQNAKKTDKSFTKKGLFGMSPKFSQQEVRDIYFDAMGLGMMRGIEIGSINGQQIDLYNSANDKQREFLDKFYKLAEEYNCAILYHPHNGMQVIDLNNE